MYHDIPTNSWECAVENFGGNYNIIEMHKLGEDDVTQEVKF